MQVISWDAVQRLLVLDRVQDPGNLGTLLRNAEGLGWDAVFLMGCCDPHNDKAIRAARGSTFQVNCANACYKPSSQYAVKFSVELLRANAVRMNWLPGMRHKGASISLSLCRCSMR